MGTKQSEHGLNGALARSAQEPPTVSKVEPERGGRGWIASEGSSATEGSRLVMASAPGRTIRVAIAVRDMGFHNEVLDFLERQPRIDVVASITDPGAGLGPTTSSTTGDRADVLVLCPAFGLTIGRQSSDLAPVLLVAEEMTVPVLRTAIEAGAQGAFCWPEEREDLVTAVRAASSRPIGPSGRRGRVIAVMGGRGGSGVTFLASHLAAAFTRRGLRAAVVDMDPSFGDLTAALGFTEPGVRTIEDLIPVAEELDPDQVSKALMHHASGFDVLLARAEAVPEGRTWGALDDAGPVVSGGLYAACVALLAGEFDCVILHLPRALGDLWRTAVRLADQTLLITGLDLMSLYGARRAMERLRTDTDDTVAVVVNCTRRADVRVSEVERVLRAKPIARIRSDPTISAAQARGKLIGHRRPAWRDVVRLASSLHVGPRVVEEVAS